MTVVNRRRVLVATAWAVPAIAVANTAPAFAASLTDPYVSIVTPQPNNRAAKNVTMRAGLNAGSRLTSKVVYRLTVTQTAGNSASAPTSWYSLDADLTNNNGTYATLGRLSTSTTGLRTVTTLDVTILPAMPLNDYVAFDVRFPDSISSGARWALSWQKIEGGVDANPSNDSPTANA